MKLELQVKNLDPIVVISLRGGIVIGQTEILRETIQSVPPTNSVVLDFARVSIIDAHGLGVMLQLREKIQATGARFELMNLSEPLRQIFEIARLHSIFLDQTNSKEAKTTNGSCWILQPSLPKDHQGQLGDCAT